MVIDESHVTLPQVHAMFGGDRARKENLVEYGFRLPAAKDNRPPASRSSNNWSAPRSTGAPHRPTTN